MAVDNSLDYTPRFTMSTIQFRSEVLNLVVTSVLIVFILANIGSAISKLVYFQRDTSFSYHSWLRAFIFANSDDPLRIYFWLRHHYVYRQPKWNRSLNKIRKRRLAIPILARITILMISFVSVAITIPQNTLLRGCDSGDYKLTFNESTARFTEIIPTVCIDIPLTTTRGTVFATAAYCNCPIIGRAELDPDSSKVYVAFDVKQSMLSTVLVSSSKIAGSLFYVEWKQQHEDATPPPRETLRSDIVNSLDAATHARIAVNAVINEVPSCIKGPTDVDSDGTITTTMINCEYSPAELIGRVDSYIRNALHWERVPRVQPRLKCGSVSAQLDQPEVRLECAVSVSVSRPIVNIVPLSFALVALILVNVIVSVAVSKHGNGLDAGFHIIKEALGHDTTSNPLEQCVERDEIQDVELRKWRCAENGWHVGFIGRKGDEPVTEFDKEVVVCGCLAARTELESAKRLNTESSSFEFSNREEWEERKDIEKGRGKIFGEKGIGKQADSLWMNKSSDGLGGFYWYKGASSEVSQVSSIQLEDEQYGKETSERGHDGNGSRGGDANEPSG